MPPASFSRADATADFQSLMALMGFPTDSQSKKPGPGVLRVTDGEEIFLCWDNGEALGRTSRHRHIRRGERMAKAT